MKTFSTGNGLPHRYRKLIKNMKMGKSKQKCTICIEGFTVGTPSATKMSPSSGSPADTSSTVSALKIGFKSIAAVLSAGWIWNYTSRLLSNLTFEPSPLNSDHIH